MSAIPIALIVILALTVAWSPIFALGLFALLFVAFLAFVGMSRRADEKLVPPPQPRAQPQQEGGTHTGFWGERRPSSAERR